MKVGIYCRVSSLTQKKEGYSLQNNTKLKSIIDFQSNFEELPQNNTSTTKSSKK